MMFLWDFLTKNSRQNFPEVPHNISVQNKVYAWYQVQDQ